MSERAKKKARRASNGQIISVRGKNVGKKRKHDPTVVPSQKRRSLDGKTQRKKWVPPDGMPNELARLVAKGKTCGAKLSNGKFCTRIPYPGQAEKGKPLPYRCPGHGGKFEGVKDWNRIGKFGPYADAILPGEEKLFETLESDSLDREIRLLKLRLTRAMRAEADQWELLHCDDPERAQEAFKETEKTRRTKIGGLVGRAEEERTSVKKPPDYSRLVHSIVNELVRVMALNIELKGEESLSRSDQTALTREAIKEAKASLGR